jgi:hypothetical protein
MNNPLKICILFSIFIILLFLYEKIKYKNAKPDYNELMQNYLLNPENLVKSKKPILWIHIPYEYNSRNWQSFGSRSSLELNQPYLYLTVKSIIKQCDESFTICIIDDNTFQKLIPDWNINMSLVSDPILKNIRTMGFMKLLYIYGGLFCPLSFLCMKNLIEMYDKGTRQNKMFVCETINKNSSSTLLQTYPSIAFCGANKESETVKQLCEYIQNILATDSTDESVFLGKIDGYIEKMNKEKRIHLINGIEIGTKTIDETPVIIDDLMSNNYIHFYDNMYGILIPSHDILNRTKFQWFARLNEEQVLKCNTILSNYILVTMGENGKILEPLTPSLNKKYEKKFVGFWKVPSDAPVWGLKPNDLGDNLQMVDYVT